MSNDIRTPPGWQVFGELPDSMEPDALGEDIVQYRSQGRIFTVDVGWWPEMDPDGAFYCRVVLNSEWTQPLEELKTRDLLRVREWLVQALNRFGTLRVPEVAEVPIVSVEPRQQGLTLTSIGGSPQQEEQWHSTSIELRPVASQSRSDNSYAGVQYSGL